MHEYTPGRPFAAGDDQVVEFPLVFCFDTTRTTIGFTYVYVCTLPQATLLYFVAHRPRASWTTSLTMELAGLVGVLIDYYELVVAPWLLSPTDALLYIPTGLSGDLFR